MKNIIVLLLIIFTSCKRASDEIAVINDISLHSELYHALRDYQHKNPIPKNVEYDKSKPPPVETSFIYIYEAKFIKDKNDTYLLITLYPTGISTYYNRQNIVVQVNGIYQDLHLKATYINDPFRLGAAHVKKYITDKKEMAKYIYSSGIIMDSMYDIYVYKVNDEKLTFHEVITGNIRGL